MLRHLSLLLGLMLLAACGQQAPNNQAQATTTPTDTVAPAQLTTPSPATANLPMATAEQDFSKPGVLELPKLEKLCLNKYGCLREHLYPLGWSPDGKFAYLLERTNEAVSDYTLTGYVLDAKVNIRVDSIHFRASEEPTYTEETNQFDFAGVWKLQAQEIQQLLNAHGIVFASGTTLHTLEAMKLTISAEDKSEVSMYTGNKVMASHTLKLQTGEANQVLHEQTYGKYDLILGTELLGLFQSPDKQHHALVEGQEQRGYEGPPNVLQLQVIGF